MKTVSVLIEKMGLAFGTWSELKKAQAERRNELEAWTEIMGEMSARMWMEAQRKATRQ